MHTAEQRWNRRGFLTTGTGTGSISAGESTLSETGTGISVTLIVSTVAEVMIVTSIFFSLIINTLNALTVITQHRP
jgi:hypothetical protein